QSDAIDKLNERLEKMQKLLRQQASPAPPSGGTTSDAAKINRIAKAVQAHAEANQGYATSGAAANVVRRSEAAAYDKLASALAKYTAARLAANAADKGATGAPFPAAPTGGSKFGPGAMPPKRRRTASSSSATPARFQTGLDTETGDLDTTVDRLAAAMSRLKAETNNFGAGKGFRELSQG